MSLKTKYSERLRCVHHARICENVRHHNKLAQHSFLTGNATIIVKSCDFTSVEAIMH